MKYNNYVTTVFIYIYGGSVAKLQNLFRILLLLVGVVPLSV